MARTRVNYKFLALAGAPILALVVLFVLWKFVPQFKWLYRGTPAQHAAQGKELYEQGKYYEAGEKYKRAIQLRGTPDAAMYTCLGDCYMHMVQKDAENLRIAKTCYDQALGVDPTYLPAQKALLDLFLTNTEMIRGTAAAQQWDDVQEVAKKVLALDPHDKEAVRTVPRATIMRWVAGLETDQQKIDDAIDSLAKIAQGPPFDTDAMWFLLQARMYRADERKRVNDREGMLAAVASALKELEDALQAHPDDALLHYRAAMVFRLASITEGRPSPNQPPKYQDRYSAELQKAAVLVQPDNEKYVELKLAWGKQLESQQDADGAEKLYRALLKERPADMPVRLALADVLSRSPASRDEAIDLLEHAPPSDPKTVYGLYALVAHNQEQLALSKVIGMKLDAAPAAQNSQAYDAQLKEIDDDFAKLLAGAGEGPATLQLRGRIEMARGKYIDAVQTLERALKLVTTGTGGGGVDIDLQYQIMYLLARANIAVKQTARAKELLTRIVTDIPKFVPARLLLVQMLLGEHEFDAAKDHLDELAKAMPDSPVVTRLRMLTLDKDKDKATLDALYNSLPERNPDEQIDKAQAAIYLGRKEETARLLEAVHGKRPDLLEVTATLARLYFDLGDKSRAVSMVDEALAKAPDNQSLKMLKAEIAGADVGELRKELIDKETDPFRKALMSFQLALQEDRQDDAQSQLELAAKLKPDNGEVLSYLFQFALGKKDFTQASALMEKLAQGNQDGAGGLLFRVRYAMAQGQYESAADMATQLTQKMPEFAQAWVVLGEVQMAQRKYNDAMSNFSQALTRQAQNLDALRGLIRCGYALDQPSTAKRYIDQARKLFPRNIVLRDIDLDHELHYGDPEKVIQPRQEILQKAIDSKDPAEARAWLALGQTYMAVARDKMIKGGAGAPAAAKPFIEKARDTFKGAVQKWPDELGFTQLYADALLQLRTPAEGEKALIALRDRPAWQNKPEPTLLLAEYYGRTGKAADQEKLLRDYLAGAPSTISVETQLAGMLTKQGKL
ncbi:MAG TPA: tetratricopeptide repeat protein, partial [Tepidisphaeraceae bacterium]